METAAVDSGVTDFVEKATLSNMFEIEASKLALERSKVQPVKDFAKMLVDGHTASLGELLKQGKANIQAPWLGFSGFLTVAGMLSLLIFIGEAVRDAFDPRKTFG
jgi:ABC-type microcin C transport system permease subunit YejE